MTMPSYPPVMSQTGHDAHWDELALGHVLGGLSSGDGSRFRRHLVGCELCRGRVAELRGVASAMADAEREELASARDVLDGEVSMRPGRPVVPPQWKVLATSVVVVLTVVLLSGWVAQLRTENAELRWVTDVQERALATLGTGDVLTLRGDVGPVGAIAVTSDRVAFTLTRVPEVAAGRQLVVWLDVDGDPRPVAAYTAGTIEDGWLASAVAVVGATRMRVTDEGLPLPAEPGTDAILDVDLMSAG